MGFYCTGFSSSQYYYTYYQRHKQVYFEKREKNKRHNKLHADLGKDYYKNYYIKWAAEERAKSLSEPKNIIVDQMNSKILKFN